MRKVHLTDTLAALCDHLAMPQRDHLEMGPEVFEVDGADLLKMLFFECGIALLPSLAGGSSTALSVTNAYGQKAWPVILLI
jgi:hypothetical protein